MRYIPYVYFLRIPLLFAVLLAALPVFGLWTGNGPHPILGGFFDLNSAGEVFSACFAALLDGAAFSVLTALVILYGDERFFAARLSPEDLEPRVVGPFRIPRAATGLVIFYGICSATLMAGVIAGADPAAWKSRLLPAAAAIAIFAAVLWITAILWHKAGSGATRFFARRLTWTPFGLLRRREGPVEPGQWPFHEPPELLPGLGLALLMIGTFALFYGLFAFGRYFYLSAIERDGAGVLRLSLPTLSSVIVLLTLTGWILGSLAYLLDRYRIPVLLPLAVLLVISAQFAQSDHYFDVRELRQEESLSPAAALRTQTAVVVAAQGGGIQASAWTGRVLTGLVEQLGDPFSRSVRVVSSVSGGSLGALYFLTAYRDGKLDINDAEAVFNASAASSLDDVAWGLVYPDLVHSLVPLLLPARIDRGWALERAWLQQLRVPFEKTRSVGQWREDARLGSRPAAIFNTTLVETGERFLLSSVDIPQAPGRRSFHDIPGHEHLDLAAVTAARLSATFTYVTPVARAACCPPLSSRYHIADGGYYDNYGMASIAELLDQATRRPGPLLRVLLVQILLSEAGTEGAGGSRGWFFQSFAPLKTLLAVRDTAQFSRNETEFRLLQEALRARGVDLERVQFIYHGHESPHEPPSPLSWHLTNDQIQRIKDRWKAYLEGRKDIDQVGAFVRGTR